MKESIKINNTEYLIDDFSTVNDYVLKITFSDKVNIETLLSDMSIFDDIKMYTQGGIICGEWQGFTTLYLHQNNDVYLSNNGSVYIKPEIPDPEPEIPDEPIIKTLDEIKDEKIAELSELCHDAIYTGVTLLIDDAEETFSYTIEDQANIKEAWNYAKASNLAVPYHANGGNCKLYTLEQITKIYVAEQINLTQQTTYFNQLKMYISSLDNIEDVEKVAYGQELTGTYLDTYNTVMNQSELIIKACFGGEN